MQQPRNFTLAGAVDLGARQNAAKRRQEAADSPAVQSGAVIDVTDETFNTEVVARSRTVPVILDLWAEWCGPCKQLSPVLERLAEQAAGAWVLAKVDVDANPQLSATLQVQSIPMVVAVIGGQLVDGFLGALPEAQVREWIAQVLAVADQLGMPPRPMNGAGEAGDEPPASQADPAAHAAQRDPAGAGESASMPGGPPGPGGLADPLLAEPRFAAAQEAMDRGDLEAAATALKQVLADMPGHPVAVAWLAQVDLLRRISGYDPARVKGAAERKPDDPAAQSQMADVELASGQVDAAFDRLLGVVQRTTGEDRETARKHLIGLFDVMPPRDPNVSKARSKLSSLLF